MNLTINTDRNTLKWRSFVRSDTPIPTGVAAHEAVTGAGISAGYTEGTKPADWDDNQSVGLFEGGGTVTRGIYRPVISCRMRDNTPPFCPVCNLWMKGVLTLLLGLKELPNYAPLEKPYNYSGLSVSSQPNGEANEKSKENQ